MPVELSPQVEGNWRWLGTKTLMFDTTKRFPMATKFTARVPAGTKSATGQVLQKDVTWTFTTPPPKVEQMIPHSQITRRDALMFISFDQEINPEAVLKNDHRNGPGQKAADPARDAGRDRRGRKYFVLRETGAAQTLDGFSGRKFGRLDGKRSARGICDQVTVEKGTPSAEGPLTTTESAELQL